MEVDPDVFRISWHDAVWTVKLMCDIYTNDSTKSLFSNLVYTLMLYVTESQPCTK